MLKVSLQAVIGIVALFGCAEQPRRQFEPLAPGERAALIEEGRQIAASQCSTCHAVAANDVSPRTDAPPLRNAIQRYDSAALTGNMMIGVRVGHPDMPLFHMGPGSADALVEYINSIRTPE
jgi:mono/diheme cytochrome c family protein